MRTMKQPLLAPASDTGSAMDAKARSRIRRSTYYCKVELPALPASGATTQRPMVNGTTGDSIQEMLWNNSSICSIEGFDNAEEVEDNMVVKKWHELGAAPPDSHPKLNSKSEVTLPWGEICSSCDGLQPILRPEVSPSGLIRLQQRAAPRRATETTPPFAMTRT
ncbi:hypothetical protein BGX38DRAFT_105834 [Terfezia claveryi]|nr:hypothetical protein BGX38DRAFT_105834 [Terfezia claveryi]